MTDKHTKQTTARKLLVHCLRLPSGVAARQVETLTDQQLDAVCDVAKEPLRTRRQVLKAVLAAVAESVEPPEPVAAEPDPAPADQPEAETTDTEATEPDPDEPEDTVVVE